MEEAPENVKESSHFAHANGMNEWMIGCMLHYNWLAYCMGTWNDMPYCNICEISINLHILDCVAVHHIKISGYSHLV